VVHSFAKASPAPKPLTSSRAAHLLQSALAWQRRLSRNPSDRDALIGMSFLALAGGQSQNAVKLAQASISAGNNRSSAWAVLAQSLKAVGRLPDAEEAYLSAIRLESSNPIAHMGLGELKLLSGRAADAIEEFEIAIRRRPSLACAHLGLGNARAILGNFSAALDQYEIALALRIRYPEAEFASGFALASLGRAKEAEARYRRAIVLKPDYAAAWINLGSLLREQGRDIAAEAALRRAVHLRPDLVSGWINLAVLERERRHFDAARDCLHRAFAVDRAQIETLIAWCQLQLAIHDVAGAQGWIRWAHAADPNHPEAVNMHGIVLHNQRQFTEAITEFECAEALGSKGAASNRGNSLIELDRIGEAISAHQHAVDVDPQNAGARYNLGLTQLRAGDWRNGWANFESRWQFREVHRKPRVLPRPRWCGEPLSGQRVLLHAEQGLGDTIQFSRYASLVATRGGMPILQVQPPVKRLLDSLAVVRAGLAQVRTLGDPRVDFDLEFPLMSLPSVFLTTVDTVPWSGAYLGANPEEINARRAQFPSLHHGPRIGIAWAGNPRYRADAQRSMRLRTLLPLLDSSPANWISLQKGEADWQLPFLLPGLQIIDGSSHDRDLAETAALVATLHLVITTDTCIAHLAGAMGKRVWILLPYLSDWRWMQEIETSPWYPTARLFRQKSPGDWSGVLDRIIAELRKLDF
jgi:tetratricopeptide (TPR) repeat protein